MQLLYLVLFIVSRYGVVLLPESTLKEFTKCLRKVVNGLLLHRYLLLTAYYLLGENVAFRTLFTLFVTACV